MISVKKLNKQDLVAVNQLLETANLPVVEINYQTEHFYKSTNDSGVIVGTIGLEIYGKYGLLRSLVVNEPYRGKGIAKLLVEQIINLSQKLNLNKLFLLTTTADKYFEKLDFERIQRNDVPEEIKQSKEYNNICPLSSTIMYKSL